MSSNAVASTAAVNKRKRKRSKSAVEKGREKYRRGEVVTTTGVKDLKLKRKLNENEKKFKEAEEKAARAEILLPAQPGLLEATGRNRTWRFSQDQLQENVDVRTAQKRFDLNLDFGSYSVTYTRNGRMALLGGHKGHIAMMDWQKFQLKTEFHVKESIRDVCFLHNETMFAVAQKKYVYIYDNTGIELHCLRNHVEPNRLEFLPYHFLMVSIGKTGRIKYQDTSTGQLVAEHKTELGDCDVMKQNPRNAVICLGHNNGQVTMWTPNMNTPVVKMLAHTAPIRALALDRLGNHMVTSGLDGQVRVWDIRTYKEVHAYYSISPASTLDISQTGLLGIGFGPHVQVWKDALTQKAKAPYMVHNIPGKTVHDVQFCPYEDILGVSHSHGFSSLIIPGSGEPNFDAFEANPFETLKQRREATVHALLEKIPPDMITLDPTLVGTIDTASADVIKLEKKERDDAKFAEEEKNKTEKYKARGRSSASKRARRKRANIVERQDKQKQEEQARRAKAKQTDKAAAAPAGPKTALDRFGRK